MLWVGLVETGTFYGQFQSVEFPLARLQSVTLGVKDNIDWEDIAVAVEGGISYIYLADTGNSALDRLYDFFMI